MTALPQDPTRRLDHLRSALEAPDPPAGILAALMESLLAVGDRAGAVNGYRKYAGAVRAGDRQTEQRLRALYERALWSTPKEVLPTNVPAARHVLIGRERETYEIAESLRKNRIVSLTGPGGVGKTRIAVEVSRRLLPEYPDGVWWVDLAPVADGAYCAEHLAHAMRASSFAHDETALVDYLSAQSALLVFDRCEHIAPAVRALLNRIASACAGIRILCTSRTPIEAAGERAVRVAALEVPDAQDTAPSAVLRSAAVQIFVERATAVDARFALGDENASEVGKLCRKLGGLPLALEIAASSAGHLPLKQIAQRVSAADSDVRATIAWSFAALPEDARAALDRFGVFAGAFSFEEAEWVTGADAAGALKRLIDASLLQMRSAGGAAEYFLLDSTREFVLARSEPEALQASARRLLQLYASLARSGAVPGAELERRFANVARAISLLADDAQSAGDRLAILAAAGARFAMSGHVDETSAMCERTLGDLPEPLRRSADYADALRTLVWLDNRRGRFKEALARSDDAIAVARASNDVPRIVRALSNLYIVAIHVGDYELARSASAEALELSAAGGDPATLSNALRAAAGCFVATGDFERAIPLYERFLNLDLDRVPRPVLAMALHDYALARLHLGQTDSAEALARRSGEVSVEAEDPGTEADAHNVLGQIAGLRGDLEEGLTLYRRALALGSRPGAHPITLARTITGCASCALRDDQMEQAAQVLGFADHLLERLHSPRQPFERPRIQALHSAISSRLGEERFQAALLVGRTRSYREIRDVILAWQPGNAPPERAKRFAALTAREREIAQLAAGGATNREIADSLHVSVRTVENHLAAIYKKLGIGSRTDLQRV
jgi:non-specific serine/threonine protein kinase